jgi:HAD superfamily hydrolase (TIGR01549 family)
VTNDSAIFLDFSNTITTVESENEAMDRYLSFIRERYNLDDGIFKKFRDLRSEKLIQRENKFKTFMEINMEVLRELYGIHDIYPERYYEYHVKFLRLRPDFHLFATSIKGLTKIVMVTDADTEYTARTVAALGISEIFDAIVTAEQVRISKPNPGIFMEALRRAGNPTRVVFVGDSERRDVEGAKRMKFFTILMGNGNDHTSADARVVNFKEVLDILEKMEIL